jgi:multiple sugar transport system permease protein
VVTVGTRRTFYQNALIYLGLVAVLLFFVGPILWFWALSLRSPTSAFASPPELFFRPTLNAFKYTFGDPGTNAPQLKSSLIVAIGATLLNLPFSMTAAYALSRFRMRGKQFLMMWYISLLMAPPVVFLIPYFIIMSTLRLRGTYFSMILIAQTITIPLSVWLLKSFFDEVPVDIEEAAQVDGASFLQAMMQITLPLSLPGIIVTSMFAFVFVWNSTIFPLVLSTQRTSTLPIGTLNYFATTGVTWNYIAATAVVTMIPPMIVFLLLGRYIVRGLTFGAVKG